MFLPPRRKITTLPIPTINNSAIICEPAEKNVLLLVYVLKRYLYMWLDRSHRQSLKISCADPDGNEKIDIQEDCNHFSIQHLDHSYCVYVDLWKTQALSFSTKRRSRQPGPILWILCVMSS